MSRPNAWQRAICQTYGHGDFSDFAHDRNWRANLDSCGDTLFAFLMIELADQEDCDSAEEALRRLGNARDDIDTAIATVTRISRH